MVTARPGPLDHLPRPLSERDRVARTSSPADRGRPARRRDRRGRRGGRDVAFERAADPGRRRPGRGGEHAPAEPPVLQPRPPRPAPPAAGGGRRPDGEPRPDRPATRDPDRLPLAAPARPADPAVRAVAVGLPHRRRRAVPRRRRLRDVLRRPDRGGARRHGPRRRAASTTSTWAGSATSSRTSTGSRRSTSGRRCRSSSSSTTATAIAASTPTSARSSSRRADRQGRPAARATRARPVGRRVPSPLRPVQPGRGRDVRHRPDGRQADEGAGPADRPDRPDARPRRAAQAAQAERQRRRRARRPGAGAPAAQRRR